MWWELLRDLNCCCSVSTLPGRDPVERALAQIIDHEGPLAKSKGLVSAEMERGGTTAIVVEASSPGFAPVQVRLLSCFASKPPWRFEFILVCLLVPG